MRRTNPRRFSSLYLLPLEDRCVPSAALDRGDVYPTTGLPTQFPEIVAAAVPPDYAFDKMGHPTGAERTRISDQLTALFPDYNEPRLHPAIDPTLRFDRSGNLLVTITGRDMPGLVSKMKPLGFVETGAAYEYYYANGYLPVGSLPAAERLEGLGGILPAGQGGTSVGSVTSEANFVMQTDFVQQQFGTGIGSRIGVISDSFNNMGGAATGIANGDLPVVNVIEDRTLAPAGSDEGRAMLELVHDIAPGADLLFATGFNDGGDVEFAENISKLADPNQGNCNVIVDDLFYANEPFYQRGVIAQAVAKAYDGGVHYFSSAGNLADQAYENIGFPTATDGAFGKSLDFDPGAGVDTRQSITIPNGKAINFVMQWDQPFYTPSGVTTNVDIRLVSSAGVVLAKSTLDNISNLTPVEYLNYTNSTGAAVTADVVISIAAGPTPSRVKWVNLGMNRQGPVTVNEYATNSSTITPHAAIASVEGVAAAPWNDITGKESFTSKRGNVTLFSDDGLTRFATPVTEPGPFFTAPDGTSTSFFGTGNNFFGTSAAAPHAAAVSAIIRGLRPDFNVSQTYNAMALTTDPRSSTVPDYAAAGMIRAVDAVTSVLAAPRVQPLQVSDGFESGTLQPYFSVRSENAGHVRVTSSDGPASGGYHFTMKGGFNELDLHVNAAGAKNYTLSFSEKRLGVSTGTDMPASFTNSSNTSGVAFSTNGTNWYRLTSLTTASQYSYQSFAYDLVAAAATAGVTLSSDTRIRFQNNSGNDMAFDNISVTRTGTVSGSVINDTNGNGVLDGGETGLGSRTVFLDANVNGRLDLGNVNTFNGGSLAIPDTNTLVESTINVGGVGANFQLVDVDVSVNLTHTFTSDLELYLVNPVGTKVQLFNNSGGNGDNILATFDDSALTPVDNGFGNFTGRYRPAQPLSTFTGGINPSFINGNWKLQAIDQSSGDVGMLNNWTLALTVNPRFSANVGVPITDFSRVISSINVTGVNGPVNDIDIGVNINHTAVGDLEIDLIAPNGARATLFQRHGGSGNDLLATTFDDSATTAIAAGPPPYAGRFRPDTALASFNGLGGNGTWSLEVRDRAGIDTGSFTNWSITIGTGEEFSSTDANGFYSFANQVGSRVVTDVPVIGWRPTNTTIESPPTIAFPPGSTSVQSFLRQVDNTPATVTGFNVIGPNLTHEVFVDYNLTFSEPVYGLTTANFVLNTNIASSYVSSVTPVTTTNYTVRVTTGPSGDGFIAPELRNSINLTDAGYNPVGNGIGTTVTIDRVTPVITSITSTTPNGTYGVGASINLTFNYSEPVTLNGTFNVGLNSGAVITVSGPQSGTALTGTYTVVGANISADLNVTAMSLVGNSTLRDAAGNQGSFALPTSNLAVNKDIVISTIPAIDSITSNVPDGIYTNNAVIDVRLNFTETVTLTGTLNVTLNTGAVVSISGPQSTATLIGTYLVAPGQTSPDLNVTALALTGGSTLRGTANNNTFVLSLPASNLAVNKNIVIAGSDITAPTIASITSQTPDGTYGVSANIDVRLLFSEPVTLQGTLNVTLNTGAVLTISGPLTGTTLVGSYTVAFNQNSSDLNVTAVALDVGSTLRDAANNNAVSTLPASNLAVNKNIVISTPATPTYVVSNTNNSGAGSLRQAILDSNVSLGFDTITFNSTFNTAKTITLASEIGITDSVTIVGPGAGLLTINGNNASRIFNTSVGPQGQVVTLRNLGITGGMANHGGAILVGDYRTLNVVDSRLFGNFSSSTGGGISTGTSEGVTINLTRSTLSGNTTGGRGGGVFNGFGGTTTITDCALTNNFCYFGGGGGAYSSGSATIRNSTISGNTAPSGGGVGIYLSAGLTLRNSTITNNSASGSGGGIRSGTLDIASSIVSGNISNTGTSDISTGTSVVLNSSAVGNATGFTFTGSNNLPFGTNLKLGALASNGGPTQSHLPALDSPLLNVGSNPAGLSADQRGLPRAFGVSDIGSVEVQATPAFATGFTVNNGAAQRSRITTIVVTFDNPVTSANYNTLGAITLTRTAVSSTPTGLVGDVVQTGPTAAGHITVTQGTSTSLILTFDNIGSFTTANGRVENGSLSDGYWRLQIGSFQSTVNDLNLRRLFGDNTASTGGTVDGSDLTFFGNSFGSGSVTFDFNNDGTVDGSDLTFFGNRFGNVL
ncbi:hypothetical protein BH11PLA2_BH11PLA2_50270 [soil metagenome]